MSIVLDRRLTIKNKSLGECALRHSAVAVEYLYAVRSMRFLPCQLSSLPCAGVVAYFRIVTGVCAHKDSYSDMSGRRAFKTISNYRAEC
eukprot:6210451-Pleurochrysis_carterae.AAC.1